MPLGAPNRLGGVRIAVLGVGLIGGSIGLAAKSRAGAQVIGWGPRQQTLDAAKEIGAIDEIATTVEEAANEADAVFACAPVELLPDLIEQALAAANKDTVVTEAGSTKRALVEAIADERFVGGHPIAGAETAGVRNAREDLFDGAAWYLTPRENTSGILFERLHRLIVTLGARPSAIEAASQHPKPAAGSPPPHVRPLAGPPPPPASLSRKRARPPGALDSHRRRAAPAHRPELPRHDARGRRQLRHLDRDLRDQPRRDRHADRRGHREARRDR